MALDGKVAVVTGGGRGIGRAIALRLAEDGADVVVSARSETELAAVVGEVEARGRKGLAVVADALHREAAKKPVRQALTRFGRIDILVNNVGGIVGMHTEFEGGDESFEATMALNVNSMWWATTAALPAMREQGWGRIVNIGSTESTQANEGGPMAYVAGKHAVAGLTRQLAHNLGKHGITVNCICPGWTNTAMVDFANLAAHMGTTPEAARAHAEGQCALNTIMEPEDIAAMAAFLCSPGGAKVTGQILAVDGGYRL
jgi:NAD(P)-dependent dehydrogenase (short-subunit alcohol dehydrogenase family)